MELKELCQQNFKGNFFNGFSLTSCWPNDDCYALIGSQKTATILKFKNTTDIIDTANIEWNSVIAPMKIPTQNILQKINPTIYSNSSLLQRQILVLDPTYAIEFTKFSKDPQIVEISWPLSKQFFNDDVIAVINNFGGCGIFTKSSIENDFNELRIYINDLLEDIFNYDPQKDIQNFEELQNWVENFCITSCCWVDSIEANKINDNCNNPTSQLLCATESGWIIAFEIRSWTAQYLFKIKTDLKSIKHLKCFSFISKDIEKLFLFITDTNGIVKIYEVYKDKFKEITNLWNKQDRMSSKFIDIEYHENIDKLLVTIVKASHFVVFVLSSDGQICNKTNYYIGNFIITGAQQVRPFEYILCTINGYIEYIQILYSVKNELNIKANHIKHDIQIDNNQVLGMITTPNKVGWLFALYKNKFKQKTFGHLSICFLNIIEPLNILVNCKNHLMKNYVDCAEIIRLKLVREIDVENYINFYPELMQTNEKFLHDLRIRQIIINGMAAQIRQKKQDKSQLIEEELHFIDDTILAIYLCDRLEYLLNLKKLTNLQKLTVTYMKKLLLNYMKKTFNIYYTEIKNKITPTAELLLKLNINVTVDSVIEKCVYCEDEIDLDSMMCKSNHNMPRCCISFIQVPVFTSRHCFRCKRIAHDDDNLLNEILNFDEGKKLLCPFCAIPFI